MSFAWTYPAAVGAVGKVQNHAAFAGFSSVVEKSALWTFPRSGFFHSSLTHKFCYRARFSLRSLRSLRLPERTSLRITWLGHSPSGCSSHRNGGLTGDGIGMFQHPHVLTLHRMNHSEFRCSSGLTHRSSSLMTTACRKTACPLQWAKPCFTSTLWAAILIACQGRPTSARRSGEIPIWL